LHILQHFEDVKDELLNNVIWPLSGRYDVKMVKERHVSHGMNITCIYQTPPPEKRNFVWLKTKRYLNFGYINPILRIRVSRIPITLKYSLKIR